MLNEKSAKILMVSDETIRNMIFILRGERVMLDEDLARIYGYTTRALNQQVKNNAAKFDKDFCYRITDEEVLELSQSKILTSMQTKGVKGGRTTNPTVFTEQGIYMLMTVLKGELAVSQSKKLIRLFKSMKDYLLDNQNFVGEGDYFRLAMQTSENTAAIRKIESEMATKDDLQKFVVNFSEACFDKEYLILDGKMIEAGIAYKEIYKKAKKSIFIVDNYIGTKTLLLLKEIPKSVKVTIFSDNLGNGKLTLAEYVDFHNEYPDVDITFMRTNGKFHDRFIVIDYNSSNERIYHCGGSSKDAGRRTTAIMQSSCKELYHPMVNELIGNAFLKLQ